MLNNRDSFVSRFAKHRRHSSVLMKYSYSWEALHKCMTPRIWMKQWRARLMTARVHYAFLSSWTAWSSGCRCWRWGMWRLRTSGTIPAPSGTRSDPWPLSTPCPRRRSQLCPGISPWVLGLLGAFGEGVAVHSYVCIDACVLYFMLHVYMCTYINENT